jgi:hypothetical protein
MENGSFPGVKQPDHGINHPPPSVPRLRKEYSYTSLPLRAFMACSKVNFTFITKNLRGCYHLLLGMSPKKLCNCLTRKWTIYSCWFFRRTLPNTSIPNCIAAIIVRRSKPGT